MIVKVGTKWMLYSHLGKVLGEHVTKKAAKAQEAAISISKARAHGHYIPKRRSRA